MTIMRPIAAQYFHTHMLPLSDNSSSLKRHPVQTKSCMLIRSDLLDLVQGVIVCADACVVHCGEAHDHWVPDAALRSAILMRPNEQAMQFQGAMFNTSSIVRLNCALPTAST